MKNKMKYILTRAIGGHNVDKLDQIIKLTSQGFLQPLWVLTGAKKGPRQGNSN